jgi:transposase
MFFGFGLVVNQYGIHLFMNTHSGNASDKSIILESIKSLKSNRSYTTEDVFTSLDEEGFEVSYMGSLQWWAYEHPPGHP